MEGKQGDHGKDYQPDLRPQEGDTWNRNPAPSSTVPDESTYAIGQWAFFRRIGREKHALGIDL